MLSAKFSAKQVCQNLGVTKETLRHYEQVGLLHPNINPDNGYREYGYWDVVTIIDILKYRSMEFSLSEIKSALYSLDFSEIVTMLETRADYYANLISKYKLLLNKSKRDFPLLLNARDHPGEIFETDIIDLVFIPFAMAESGGGRGMPYRGKLFIAMLLCFRQRFTSVQLTIWNLMVLSQKRALRRFSKSAKESQSHNPI